ncbi:hypothetical protein L1987_36565 [Smallanthus sonchifolius]|uniref:Uncharacterized protein n=1 Tax=Smallanthus sonchifolius TaxID=185202 RepID=A0ACB9HDY1_9ASTR|nr:hypothetical protein L1987_36565 [Smallanthus sonchifolius]
MPSSKNSRFQMGRQQQTYPSETTTGITKRCSRKQVIDEKSCRYCMASVIADCVAVCCCPCAVVNFFTLTFLKLPWMMGRKCLGSKKKKKKLKNEDSGKVPAIEEEEEESGSCKYSARFEAERVWLELYKVDNLGFGRVSFNGIHALG